MGVVAATLLVFTLLLANFFDLLGTMVGVSNAGGIKDEKGEIPYSRRIMVSDALGTMGGGMGGTSVNSGFIESTVGVGDAPAPVWPMWPPVCSSWPRSCWPRWPS